MDFDILRELYQDIILDNAKQPKNNYLLEKADRKIELANTSCGDLIQLRIKLKKDRIEEIAFTGHGCTISQASASIMTDLLKDMDIKSALDSIKDFSDLLIGRKINKDKEEKLGDAFVLASVKTFPTRIKCAALAWHAAENILKAERCEK
ncbi:Fe-S cluster assembly sulfur transfer protein SufU [Oenococcus alcoholitolerans]|uniref:NIF system FeS cluster assembly NifU N-terminal domain-containing protein n=1 Tax=Oenococcus alcoholitolerans TaxID=931074 RepID=A0ABR4XS83_9LACO|nr:hypothetical protein Q757_01540 [Oenococcus alcoholitolerans]